MPPGRTPSRDGSPARNRPLEAPRGAAAAIAAATAVTNQMTVSLSQPPSRYASPPREGTAAALSGALPYLGDRACEALDGGTCHAIEGNEERLTVGPSPYLGERSVGPSPYMGERATLGPLTPQVSMPNVVVYPFQ